MDLEHAVTQIIMSTLNIPKQSLKADADTKLYGSLAEFDSMSVVSILTGIEDHFGITINDDEINAEIFTTIGSVCNFVARKLKQ